MQTPGLGYVLLHPDLDKTRGGAASVQSAVLTSLCERQTQIMPLEALAILQAFLVFMPAGLAGRDILLFVDNQAVCSALAKGASSAEDVGLICTVCHLLWARYSIRVWVEWVPSDDNPADGLSRAGLSDSWTMTQDWVCSPHPCLPWPQVSNLPLLDIPDVLLHWSKTLE